MQAPRHYQLPTSAVTETPVNLTIRGQAIRYELHQVPARDLQFADIIRVTGSQMKAGAAEMAVKGFPGNAYYVEINGVKYALDGNNRLNMALHGGLETIPSKQVTLPFRGYQTEADVLQMNYEALYGRLQNR